MHSLSRILLVLAVVACCGCGSAGSGHGRPAGSGAGGGLPGLNALTVNRAALASGSLLLSGTAAVEHSSGAVAEGAGLRLDASAGGSLQWALYAFDPAGRTVAGLQVNVATQPGSMAWVALADYARQAWAWQPQNASSQLYPLEPSRQVSPDGLVYCVVAAYAGSSVLVESASVGLKPLATGAFTPGTALTLAPETTVEVRCPPDMLGEPATVRVFEGARGASAGYVTAPVQVEITRGDGSEAPVGTPYEYAYSIGPEYTADCDVLLYDTSGTEPQALFGWAKPDAGNEVRKAVEYSPQASLAVVDLSQMRFASSASAIGLRFDAPADVDKAYHVILIHGLDWWGDINPPADYRTQHWDSYAPPGNPGQLLSAVDPAVRPNVAISHFYYNTLSMPVFGPGGSGLYLAQQIEQKLLTPNPDAKVVLVGYSMGGVLIRAGYDELCKAGHGDCILGAVTLDGVNNGTEVVNMMATDPYQSWFPVPDCPGIRDLRSRYDAQFLFKTQLVQIPVAVWTGDPNTALADIADNAQYTADLWGTSKYIRLGSSGFATWSVGLLYGNPQFNRILKLRAAGGPELDAAQTFLRAGNGQALHDGIVSLGSQLAAGFTDTTFDDVPGLGMVRHAADHEGALNSSEVNGKLQAALGELLIPGWQIVVVDSTGDVGYSSSLAVVNGNPAVSYGGANGQLKYAYSDIADGSAGWHNILLNIAGDVPSYPSLAAVNGKPAIGFYDNTNADLKYIWSSTAQGAAPADWNLLAVDSLGEVGKSASLAVVNGKPAMSYLDYTNHDLKYAWSSVTDGSSGWNSLAVDTGQVGIGISLAVVNGKPAIAYLNTASLDLMYAWSNTVNGSSGWSTLTVDAPGNVGQFASLEVINGKPAISYRNYTSPGLKYAWSSVADGSFGWNSLTVTSGNLGPSASLANVNGNPTIGYYSDTDLKYARSSTVDGSSGWSTLDVESEAAVDVCLAVVDGKLALSYYDLNNEDLKYAVLFE